MCHISLKFQDKNYFLKLNARMMRAAEQGPCKNPLKIEISIKTFRYSVKFEERKKKSMGFTEILFLCRGWTWRKVWHTAMTDSATD